MMKVIKKKIYILPILVLLLAACGKNDSQDVPNAVEPEKMEVSNEDMTELPKDDSSTAEDEDKKEDDNMSDENILTLREAVPESMNGARIGCEATLFEIQDPKVFEIITSQFNAITFGNELKPDSLFGYSNSKCPGTVEDELNGETIIVPKLDFSRPEQMLDMIYDWNANNPDKIIMVRGHVLVWHSQTPEWFFHVDYDKNKDYVDIDTMNKRLEWYIKTVLEHFLSEDSKYKDMFYGWDVVNEAVSDNGGKLRSDHENDSEDLLSDTHGSNSSWYHVYQSNEFIINAFIYANKYAPESLELYYNDYNECNAVKRQGILELLTAIKEKEGPKGEGTRISGMGMQGHYGMEDPNQSAVELSIKEYAKVVSTVQITEFDIQASSSYDGTDEKKDEEYEKLRKRYNTLYYAIRSANNDPLTQVTGITFWGTVDHYSWLQNRSNVGGGSKTGLPQCPLLFDENYEPKSAFYVFAKIY